MRTRAALFREAGAPLEVCAVDLAEPGPDEVVVRMAAVGVCGSDLHVIRGEWPRPTPMVLGHEGAGTIEAVGSNVGSHAVGDRVVISWAPACGGCGACAAGSLTACTSLRAAIGAGTKLDGHTGISLPSGEPVYRMTTVGAFAEHVLVPAVAALPLAGDVTLEAAALLGCAALTGVGAVEHAAGVEKGESVLVFGAGGVGQFVVQAARLVQADPVIVVDPVAERRHQVLGLGATAAIRPAELAGVLARECPDGVDHAIEVVGSAETAQAAVEAVRPGGRVTLVGLPPVGTRLDLDPFQLVAQEKTITGSIYGSESPAASLPRLVEHARAGRLSFEQMLGPRYPLDRVNDAAAASLAGSPGRVMLVP